ncbi:MAG: Uma2 family endonuclease [Pyrinomonadaceae bacterium]
MDLIVAKEKRPSALSPVSKNGGKQIYYPESDGKPMAETDVHITLIADLLQTLRTYFSQTKDVKVLADILLYYEEGNPHKSIAPDVMIVSGVGKHLRRTFKLWEERPPDVVFEISSRGTWKEDLQKKFFLYRDFGVKEYYIFDPEYDYLKDEPLVAYHLKNGEFKSVKIKRGRVHSPFLNLDVVDTGAGLRLYNPETKAFLPLAEELATRTEKLESEVERLKAEVARLKKHG